MEMRKALIFVVAVIVTLATGCVSADRHQREVSALQNRLENEVRALSETERELEEMGRAYRQKTAELEDVRSEAEELTELSQRLRQAEEERKRRLEEMEDLVRDISGMTIQDRAEGDFIVIENEILFDPGQNELKEDAKETIKDSVVPYITEQLARNGEQLVRVDGHTDGQPIVVSPWDDNHHLSVMRAHSVMRFLVEEGVPEQNLFLAGFGPNQPIIEPPEPEADVPENRRVEILLVPLREDDIQSILDEFIR